MIPDDPSVASYAHRPANTHAFARTLAKLPREVTDVPDASRRTSPATFARSTSTRGGPTRPTASAPSATSRGRGRRRRRGARGGRGGGAARGGAASGSSALGSGSRAVPGVVVGRGGRRARGVDARPVNTRRAEGRARGGDERLALALDVHAQDAAHVPTQRVDRVRVGRARGRAGARAGLVVPGGVVAHGALPRVPGGDERHDLAAALRRTRGRLAARVAHFPAILVPGAHIE